MKPLDARTRLQEVAGILAAGQPLPPILRAWLVLALRNRLADPGADLDRLLGLRSRAGGRLHAFSRNPARDRALRELVGSEGSISDRAGRLLARVQAHRRAPESELAALEAAHGRIPASLAQLQRILAGRTAASRMDG